MHPPKSRPWHFWSEESGLTGLLIFSVAYMFAMCALGRFALGDLVARLLFSFIIVAGILATFRQRLVRFFAIVLAGASLILTWLEHIHPVKIVVFLDAILALIFIGFLLAVLIVQVFGAGRVTAHRIRGAIVVYLLLGGLWSYFYFIVALVISPAFHFPHPLVVADYRALMRSLTYFSYITLTTTGFGDITPTLPLTRTLAMFEALAGQLYLVITMARLVSLAIISRTDNLHSKK